MLCFALCTEDFHPLRVDSCLNYVAQLVALLSVVWLCVIFTAKYYSLRRFPSALPECTVSGLALVTMFLVAVSQRAMPSAMEVTGLLLMNANIVTFLPREEDSRWRTGAVYTQSILLENIPPPRILEKGEKLYRAL